MTSTDTIAVLRLVYSFKGTRRMAMAFLSQRTNLITKRAAWQIAINIIEVEIRMCVTQTLGKDKMKFYVHIVYDFT